ncbi:MAG: HAMP domain-containing histidine kinase [Pseudomonadales bacterium]|nr:HAMP domain-containing histidine kinase [Pseudomonadales bacterium]
MFWKSFNANKSLLGLFLAYIASGLGVGLVTVLALLYWVFTSNTEFLVRDGLFGQAEEIAAALTFDASGQPQLDIHEPMNWAYDAYYTNLKYRIVGPDQNLLFTSDGDSGLLLPDGISSLEDAPKYYSLPGADGDLHVGNFEFDRDGTELIIQTARGDRFGELAAEAIMPAVFETASILAVAGFLIFLVALGLAVRSAIHRIRKVSAAAEVINPDNMEARIDGTDVPIEIAPLVTAFNSALDRIADGLRVQQRFIANAAHELKTPLAIIRAQVELSHDNESRGQLLSDIDEMADHVKQMLHLSQVQDNRNYHFEQADLRLLAEEVVRSFAGLPLAQDKRFEIAGLEHRELRVDRAASFTALRNLVENAVKCSREGGLITILVQSDGFVVQDEGPGIDESRSSLLFERFWRADTSTTDGTGLGLSIVAEIARAHGGAVSARNREEGKGAVFALVLRANAE